MFELYDGGKVILLRRKTPSFRAGRMSVAYLNLRWTQLNISGQRLESRKKKSARLRKLWRKSHSILLTPYRLKTLRKRGQIRRKPLLLSETTI